MRLLLVRHGESEHLVRKIAATERGCLGLTDHGREQATALAERLAPADVLLTSPAPRATETAAILRPALGVGTTHHDRRLTELRLGAGDGLPRTEFTKRYPAFDLVAEPDRPIAPGGESWHDFNRRVATTMTALAERYAGQRVVAVTHAGFIVVAFLSLFNVPRPGPRLDPEPASITEWAHDGGTWRLVRYNDVTHRPAVAPAWPTL